MDDAGNQSGGRFVILRHEMPPEAERSSHWDFMLENRGVLLTWEFPKLLPGQLPATFEQLGIRRLPDHRIDYLQYEGPVSNGRGTVKRVDSGSYQVTGQASRDLVNVKATGKFFQIELLVPKAIFQQVDEPILEAGQLLRFLDLSKAKSDGAFSNPV